MRSRELQQAAGLPLVLWLTANELDKLEDAVQWCQDQHGIFCRCSLCLGAREELEVALALAESALEEVAATK